MKFLFTIFLILTSYTDLDKIARQNELKKEAKEAYNRGDYQKALSTYRVLTDSMSVHDDNISLNMANAYYQLKDSANAVNTYNTLISSNNEVVKSVANQQLGIIANKANKQEEALQYFKNAIKADPKNKDARYNYEMLKKALEKKKEEEEQQKQDQEGDKENQEQEKQDQEQENDQKQPGDDSDPQDDEQQKDEQNAEKKEGGDPAQEQDEESKDAERTDKEDSEEDRMNSVTQKLEDMNMTEEKAQMILEALKNKEIQYYQQHKRKASQPKDNSKPDW